MPPVAVIPSPSFLMLPVLLMAFPTIRKQPDGGQHSIAGNEPPVDLVSPSRFLVPRKLQAHFGNFGSLAAIANAFTVIPQIY